MSPGRPSPASEGLTGVVNSTPRVQVHRVHRPVEGQTISVAALLSALELEDDEENRPPTGSSAGDEPYRRTIIRPADQHARLIANQLGDHHVTLLNALAAIGHQS